MMLAISCSAIVDDDNDVDDGIKMHKIESSTGQVDKVRQAWAHSVPWIRKVCLECSNKQWRKGSNAGPQ